MEVYWLQKGLGELRVKIREVWSSAGKYASDKPNLLKTVPTAIWRNNSVFIYEENRAFKKY